MASSRGGFNSDELAYYSRQLVLSEIGLNGQKKLKSARVLVAGVGGLGCQLSVQLASMGVGFLRLADRDVVEMSNLQRQHLYGVDVVGYPKVEAAEMRLRKVNPFIDIEALPVSVNDRTAAKLVDSVDIVVDGLDRLTPRLALNRACVEHGVPYVYGAVITHVGNVSTIIPGETPCLECWQGGVDEANVPTCATVGVMPPAISVIASIQVSEAARIILGEKSRLAGKLLFFDLDDLSMEKINLAKAESCRVCGSGTADPGVSDPVEEICGRGGKRVFTITPDELIDLNLSEVETRLTALKLEKSLATRLGLTFSDGKGLSGSVFKTGVAVFEGAESRVNATDLYRKLTGVRIE
ncbi:MAG: HesA/MoeB/ThiF family protein [Candidatus Bathyarchaeota archaeon]|nr:HesA/MoeB/ThiF family protein [Candidatus Bathyarchaeota archaeon]